MTKPEFHLEASFDETTGGTVAVYLRIRTGDVKETKAIEEGVAYADYDAHGLLLGVELLGPCEVGVLERIADQEPEPVKRFLKGCPPRELVRA
jgi:hypothetical protein